MASLKDPTRSPRRGISSLRCKCVAIIFLLLVLTVLLVVLSVMVVRALLITTPQMPCSWSDNEQELVIREQDRNLSQRLAAALQFPTVSSEKGVYNSTALAGFIDYIEKAFPQIHSSELVTREVVANHSLLFEIRGSDPNLTAYMLCGHLDVVPAVASRWKQPPFGGKVVDGEIWGRGAIDAKNIVMGILEALEYRLEQGDRPRRSLFVALGHDEEVGGTHGAAAIRQVLRARNVQQLEFILDEGMMVLQNLLPGLKRPVALVAVTEKGMIMARVSARGTSGHSSAPPVYSAIVTLAQVLTGFHGQCHPAQLGGSVAAEMLTALAPEVPFHLRMALANLWIMEPAIRWYMSRSPQMDPLIRTTTAVTRIKGGIKDNVVPAEAHAMINHRVNPSQTVAEVLARDRELLGGRPNVTLEVIRSMEAHPVSPHGHQDLGFNAIACSVRRIFPDALPVPALAIGNTDTRHYLDLTRNVYRFSPTLLTPQEAFRRFHGDNERISVENYEQLVNFYRLVMRSADRCSNPSKSRDEL